MIRNSMSMIGLIAAATLGCAGFSPRAAAPEVLHVAVLKDKGTSGSADHCIEILTATPGMTCVAISGEQIRNGALAGKHVFIMPGGSGTAQCESLGEEGGQRVHDFVERGGGAIGICAGGYAMAMTADPQDINSVVDLINVQTKDSRHWRRGIQMVEIAPTHPGEGIIELYYANGPLWQPYASPELPNAAVLAVFRSDVALNGAPAGQMPGTPAIVAAPHKQGRVILFSPHPEHPPQRPDILVGAVRWAARGPLAEGESINWQTVFGPQVP